MANPGFQEYMRPILEYLNDRNEVHRGAIAEDIAQILKLSAEDKMQKLPSNMEPIYLNRIGWAITYLKKAGLLDSPKRSLFAITEEGRTALKSTKGAINSKFLRRYPSFLEFQTASKKSTIIEPNDNNIEERTPEEIFQEQYKKMRSAVCADLLSKIIEQTPSFFEKLIVDLLLAMGYGSQRHDAGKVLGQSGDGGIDGIINEDKLGLDVIYLQAKKWNRNNLVGRPEIQRFVGALSGQKAKKGIFITTSAFTKEASDYNPHDISLILIDGNRLVELMFEYNVGVSSKQKFEIKAIDNDYFEI